MDDAYIGEIRIFAINFVPQDWVACDGRLLNIQEYQALYAIIEQTYGGDGVRTFAVPDLRGRVVLGAGKSESGNLCAPGYIGGDSSVTLTSQQLPIHTHLLSRKAAQNSITGKTSAPEAASNLGSLAQLVGTTSTINVNCLETSGRPSTKLASESMGVTGVGVAHNNLQPYLNLGFCICVEGEFPVRP